MSPFGGRGRLLAATGAVLAATLFNGPSTAAEGNADTLPDVVVKAALIYNFAKFTVWPALADRAPIVVCFVGDTGIAAAFVETVRGQNIGGHLLDVSRPEAIATWRACNLLFVSDVDRRRATGGLNDLKTLPVLTVSDGNGFAQTDGIIELYIEDGRMRFAINVDAADRSGLRLSSRLLGLAKIIRNNHVE